MQRAVTLGVVVMAAVMVIQFVALRRMRVEISRLQARAIAYDIDARRAEVVRTGQWLHAWLQSPEGGSHPQGLCEGGAPDVASIGTLIFGTYMQARGGGASEAEAREAVAARARGGR